MRWGCKSLPKRQQTAVKTHATKLSMQFFSRHVCQDALDKGALDTSIRIGLMLFLAGFAVPCLAWQTTPQSQQMAEPNALANDKQNDKQAVQSEALSEAASTEPQAMESPKVSADNTFALADPQVVQLYSQDELLALIRQNEHLNRVKQDDCQLVRDIEARADIMKLPSYQFLFGDMLAYGVCVPKDIERGWDLMQAAALQGLPEGLEQLGRYYHLGKFVQKDSAKARQFLFQAAAMGNLPAKIRLADMMLEDQGSPVDYETVYRWLHHAVTADDATHQRITVLLSQLAKRMPAAAVQRAQQPI